MNLCLFSFFSRRNLIYKSCRIIRIFPLPFHSAIGDHLFSSCDLLRADSLLVCSIFGRIGYDQPLMEFFCSIRFIFIKKSLFIILGKLCDINRRIIRQPFKSFGVQSPFTILCRKLFDRLCHNKRTLSEMIEDPVIFRCQTGIAAIDKFLTAELLKDLCLQRF